MLNKIALANSSAALAAIIYVLTLGLSAVSPALFKVVFDAQFLGARISESFPAAPTATEILTDFLIFTVSCWLLGYLLGWLYNVFTSKK